MKRILPSTSQWILLLIATVGCDEQATQIARQAADRQAQQNTAMAELQKEVASGAHELVASDSKTREGILSVHHDLQSERQRLDASWTSLEAGRKRLASERQTASVLAPVATLISGVLLAAVVLSFCRYVLFTASSSNTDAVINEILIGEVFAGSRILVEPIDADAAEQALIGK